MYSRREFLRCLSASTACGLSLSAVMARRPKRQTSTARLRAARARGRCSRSRFRSIRRRPMRSSPRCRSTRRTTPGTSASRIGRCIRTRAASSPRSAGKPLRCNYDMAYILVPTSQKKVDVRITRLPAGIRSRAVSRAGQRADRRLADLRLAKTRAWRTDTRRRAARPALAQAATGTPSSSTRPTRMLYEFWQMKKTAAGWQAAQASIFDLKTNKLRPDGWTSADAAGLPIFPAIVRYDEIKRGVIEHAMRVTVRRTRKAYVAPATHFASRDNRPQFAADGRAAPPARRLRHFAVSRLRPRRS